LRGLRLRKRTQCKPRERDEHATRRVAMGPRTLVDVFLHVIPQRNHTKNQPLTEEG